MIFLAFFLVPLLIAVSGYIWFGKRVTLKELILQVVLQAVVVGCTCAVIYYKNTDDTETWNGRIEGKSRDIVSCSHSYPCNCRSVSCGKNCSTTHCDTCHEHSYDVDWNVRTSNNEHFEISRVDSQGINEPPRWSSVRMGEPTSLPHHYENYIKASPDSIFRSGGESKEVMPGYPNGYYDYYRLDRLVQVGMSIPDAAEWNKDLTELNADLGRARQVNIVLVLTRDKPREWYKYLERQWIGGKKNDVVLVINTSADGAISWVETMAWTDHAYFKVRLRDEVYSIGKLDRAAIFGALRADISEQFKRKPMSDFSYLRAAVTPSTTEFVVGMIVCTIAALLLGWWVEENDIFGDEDRDGRFYSRMYR